MKTSRPINRLRTVHPGEILREAFPAPLGMSANELSLALSVPDTRIHAILKARRAVSADTAERLTRYFGVVLQRFELVTCEHQLEELRRSIPYPKLRSVLQPHWVGTMVNNLQRAIVLEELPGGYDAHDPNDALLLAMAHAGQAQYLVTGDHRSGLLGRDTRGEPRVLTPGAFCSELL